LFFLQFSLFIFAIFSDSQMGKGMQHENDGGEKKEKKKGGGGVHSFRKCCRSFWHLELEQALSASVEFLVAV
jgi:hypothetical protein